MRASLLAVDLEEFERTGVAVGSAFARGARALDRRQLHEHLVEASGTEAGLTELIDLYAQANARMHLLQFDYMTRAGAYAESKERYDAVDDVLFDLRRHVVPALRAHLAETRQREAELVMEAEGRGIATAEIGPIVPPDRAQVTSLRPGEGPLRRRTLTPLSPRPTRLQRLRRLLRR
jgi:hypothetical protein